MSSRFATKLITIILAITTLGVLLSAPWSLSLIDNIAWRVFLWAMILFLAMGIAVAVGLMPYFGQKEITKDVENHNIQLTEYLGIERKKVDELEKRIAKHRDKFGDTD